MKTNHNTHVIFGTGPLGLSVMQELLNRSQKVRMVNRSGQAKVPAGVEVVAADAYSSQETMRVCQDASVVYQCAQPPYNQWAEKFPPLQESILNGAAKAGARLVLAENLYMYGEVSGSIHEGLPYNAQTRKGQVRGKMSEAALAAHQAGQVQVTIGRAADFFGPNVLNSAMGERVFMPILKGKAASLVGNLDLPHTYTYIEDFGKALVILGEREEALGQAWHVPNPETVTQRAFMELVFKEVGQPVKMSSMGRFMMSLGGLFIPEARETVEMLYEFEKPFVVDSQRFSQTFGIQATSLTEAIRRTVQWYRTHQG
jgi:nucleoside-diphosphate-sugar epimerase